MIYFLYRIWIQKFIDNSPKNSLGKQGPAEGRVDEVNEGRPQAEQVYQHVVEDGGQAPEELKVPGGACRRVDHQNLHQGAQPVAEAAEAAPAQHTRHLADLLEWELEAADEDLVEVVEELLGCAHQYADGVVALLWQSQIDQAFKIVYVHKYKNSIK